ncbi:MAG: lipase [Rhizobiaceae bacterium]|nr:lipase [Rhizobiaceae bacterium]
MQMFARNSHADRTNGQVALLRVCAVFLAILLAPLQAHAGPMADDVYILRGGFGVFSTGLDGLRKQLKENGVNASLVSYQSWRRVARTIAENQGKYGRRPVVIIGHSLGGNNAVLAANELKKKGIQVDLIVSFASTAPMTVPSNVRNVLNFYFKSGGWGGFFTGASDFRGSLNNVDLSNQTGLNHFNVDDDPGVRNEVVRAVSRYFSPTARSQ